MSAIATNAAAGKPRWVRRRSVPLPTWRVWVITLALGGGIVWWLGRSVHDWLAVRDPIEDAPYVVVEGWCPDYVLDEAVAWARRHDTKCIFTTGIPIEVGSHLSEHKNYADVAAATLVKQGWDKDKVRTAPADRVDIERTRAMAMKVRELLAADEVPAADRRVNVFTLGTHGRRTRKLFQKVLGDGWKVGIVSVPSRSYDAGKWYRQSDGAKTVINELVALTVQSSGAP